MFFIITHYCKKGRYTPTKKILNLCDFLGFSLLLKFCFTLLHNPKSTFMTSAALTLKCYFYNFSNSRFRVLVYFTEVYREKKLYLRNDLCPTLLFIFDFVFYSVFVSMNY